MAVIAPGTAFAAPFRNALVERLGESKFGLWFDQSARVETADDGVVITVPSRFHADWIDRHFRADVEAACAAAGLAGALRVEVDAAAFARPASSAAAPPSAPAAAAASARPRPRLDDSSLDVRFDLSRFVVGPSNRLAYDACERFASGEAGFSPLFVHGPCGVGKTHLLRGICRRVLVEQPGAKVRYVTGEEFTNEYIQAVRTNRLEPFRRMIRSLDLLALDDVHFLSNKQATQNEFLHTFDSIGLTGARLVLASDEHPRRIRAFHHRLVSRFLAGLVVSVDLPDEATRRQLVEAMARRRGLRLNEAAIEAIVQRVCGSVRELEGAIFRLEATARLLAGVSSDDSGLAVGMVAVNEAFRVPEAEALGPVPMSRIIDAVIRRFGVEREELLGARRHQALVNARSIAAYLARQLTMMSLPEIASAMNKNASTVLNSVRRVEGWIQAEATISTPGGAVAVAGLVEAMVHELRGGGR